MQMYLGAIFNHFRSMQAWASDKDANLTLDVKSFEIEVKHRGRYYPMYPLFQGKIDGRLVHSGSMPQELVSFGGWRPYRTITHTHSTNKLLFKGFLRQAGLRTPSSVEPLATEARPDFDYILKAAVGSFGREIAGPFRRGQPIDLATARHTNRTDPIFAEQFIEGSAVKVWFWGSRPFFAHAHGFPTIVGDGGLTADQLVHARLRECLLDWHEYADREIILECLRFQGIGPHSVLQAGESCWIDYRFAQRYERAQGTTSSSDNALPELLQQTGEQIPAMGHALARLLAQSFPLPVMISVDCMLDSGGGLWWLEMNTNSVMPPEGYETMFADLFS